MQSVIIAVLTISYILVAYVGPVAALGFSVYWAYQSSQAGGSLGGAIGTFCISAIVLLLALMLAKRLLKWIMNMVDLDDDADPASGE